MNGQVEIRWRDCKSSNVEQVGWPSTGEPVMFVLFKSGHIYAYRGVSRQRAVAMWLAQSVGGYLNRVIKPTYPVSRIAGL